MGSMGSTNHLVEQARSLIRRSVQGYHDQYGFGTMSCSAYDTAWVSLVAKVVNGQRQWLFPECFEHLLVTQSDEGGWVNGKASQIDGILNTAAPLLALLRHAAAPLQLNHDAKLVAYRIEKATASLRSQLVDWDVSTTDHVGFEIIVPAMLNLLAEEDSSLLFDFEAKEALMSTHDTKMALFWPEFLYGSRQTTALHSLEAFIGKIDFDRVSHHKVHGSMMGSPSSTAAYLMHTSEWDEESEAYLRHVIRAASGQGGGGVPSAFPSTHFEYSWILSTLLGAGFSSCDLASRELKKMTNVLSSSFETERGVLGFASSFEADADDTAKAITALHLLGQVASPEKMVEVFEADTHFRTYQGERDPSFTSNCNILQALLHQPDVSAYSSQVLKVAKFLCEHWWTTDGRIKDKWNTSYLYPSFLLVGSLVSLMASLEQNRLLHVFDEDLQSRIAVTLAQACLRPLFDQKDDGSWNHSMEETAYGVLILCEARRLYIFDDLREPLDSAIVRGVAFLDSNDSQVQNYVWIEKVTYASPLLTESYLLAARKAASCPVVASVGSDLEPKSSSKRMDQYARLFHQTPLFESLPEWELRASLIEASLFLPLLRPRRLDVFPRKGVEDDKYFDLIPFFWTSPNNRARTYASTWFLYEMMNITLLTMQVDEFMEAVAGPSFLSHTAELRQLIYDVFRMTESVGAHPVKCDDATHELDGRSRADGGKRNGQRSCDPQQCDDDIVNPLSKFTRYILENSSIQASSHWDQEIIKSELQTYLLAHVQQAEDNARIAWRTNGGRRASTSASTFFGWVRTTGADHSACPFSFFVVSCLIRSSLTPKGDGGDCFPTVEEKYLATSVCRHLSTMCRMYNDLGSVARDEDEGNLNSINFVEFDCHVDVEAKKGALLNMASFERACLREALERLKMQGKNRCGLARRLAERWSCILTMFCEQVDLFGQVHTHSPTCVKYSIGKNKRGGDLCRFKAPWKLVKTTALTPDGVLEIRKTHPMVNRRNQAIAVGLRHNHDISFIATQRKTMALVHYVTNYATKVEDPIWKRVAAAADLLSVTYPADPLRGEEAAEGEVAIGRSADDSGGDGAGNKTRQFLMKVANRVFTERTLSQVEVIADLLGYPVEYTNSSGWAYLNVSLLYWHVFRRWRHLRRESGAADGEDLAA
ncbi:Copalyl diphosphate synthase-like protein [Purpureocillium lavendulum]|uniref:Copalyl diphosphate synthase-like protein n=1 Tax=Purpureocillium lavendulum TaxID=1247861 RepID=A0AB34FJU5_9HYPO|nr:Copalyl diphosphate synthase-like protein [Purpureocillium lavendulum]